MLSLLDLLFSPHEDDELFVEVCGDLDREKNPLTKEERFDAYKRSIEHFHCLTRNYPAWWNAVTAGPIDIARFDRSLYNLALTAYGQRIDLMPQEIAEMNYSLYGEANNRPRAEAMSRFMTAMLHALHTNAYAKLAS